MQQIEPGIFYEDSYFGVTLGALVSAGGIIMIDAPLRGEEARAWRTTLLNQRGGMNRVLVCLDAHPDRTLGARALETTIITHQETATVFRNRPTIFKGQSYESGADWETNTDVIGIRWAMPDITFSSSMTLHWGEVDVILEHHPGPMPGSIWIVVPNEKVVFVGDTIVVDQPPFLAYAEIEEWIDNLDRLIRSFKDFVIVSGRGGPVTVKEARAQQRVLKNILAGLERLAKKEAAPEETENLVNNLIKNYAVDDELRERFAKRMQYGLYQCYTRRYRNLSNMGNGEGEPEQS